MVSVLYIFLPLFFVILGQSPRFMGRLAPRPMKTPLHDPAFDLRSPGSELPFELHVREVGTDVVRSQLFDVSLVVNFSKSFKSSAVLRERERLRSE